MDIFYNFFNFLKNKNKSKNIKDILIDDNYSLLEIKKINLVNEITKTETLKINQSEVKIINDIYVLSSKMVGVYFFSSDLKKISEINIGDKIKKGQILGFIKSLGNYNEITSDFNGAVQEINVKDSSLIEYNQKLFVIKTEDENS